MAAVEKPLRIDQGATWAALFDAGEDLSGYTLAMEIRDRPGGTLLAAPTLTWTLQAGGQFTASLTAAQTAQLAFRGAVYDVEATSGATVRRLFQGTVVLSHEVTVDEVEAGSFPVPGTPPGSVYMRIVSAVADGAAAVAHIMDTAVAYVTAGAKLLSLRNGGVEKLNVDKDGNLTTSGTLWGGTAVKGPAMIDNAGVTRVSIPSANTTTFLSTEVDGASAEGTVFNTANNLAAAGAKLASFKNQGVTQLSVGFDGKLSKIALQSPPTITGSRGGNAALASLLTALAAQGIIIDNTTA